MATTLVAAASPEAHGICRFDVPGSDPPASQAARVEAGDDAFAGRGDLHGVGLDLARVPRLATCLASGGHSTVLGRGVDETLPPSIGSRRAGGDERQRVPGVVVVFSRGVPEARVISCAAGAVELGRGDASGAGLDDGRVSRRHARIEFSSGRCMVTDLGSQNGTVVDGALAAAHAPTPAQRVIRAGDSLLIPYPDVRPLENGVHSVDGFVRGPAMQAVLEEAERAAQGGILHVRGENGTGKEGVAQAFHRATGRAARALVAVNCAAIPHAIAERLLFGAKRGTYSGADADAPGYVQDADGGTLFLDEIAELDLEVQAKLLRVLESREVLALGTSKPRKVDFALCSATGKDLRALVAAGKLREDLYFRIAMPGVMLPPLRNRPEEIPVLVAQELAKLSSAPTAHVSLLEQCLLRPWPGNVRELLAAIRTAARSAIAEGRRVEARHLAATAGMAFGGAAPEVRSVPPEAPASATSPTPSPDGSRRQAPRDDAEQRQRIEEALRAHAGNVAATARALGLHRTQLRRFVERYGIAVDAFAGEDSED